MQGIRIGHHQRVGGGWLTGTTVVLTGADGAIGGVDVRGGGPGTRETDLLDPRALVERVHAVVLSGGSAYGLAAADGVMSHLYAAGVGFPVGAAREVVPIVPAAVIFDLGRGGDFGARPDADFGGWACAAASPAPTLQGVVGAGTGAQAGGLKGGVGSASAVLPDGTTVAALVVVNAVGSTVDPASGELYGARHLLDGDLDLELPTATATATSAPTATPTSAPPGATHPGERTAYRLRTPDHEEVAAAQAAAREAGPARGPQRTLASTVGVIATDATLTKAQCAKVSGVGHDGMARAISPVHTMYDGDTLFTLATCGRGAPDPTALHLLLDAAAGCVTRAVVRAMLAAQTVTTSAGTWRSYRDVFPSAVERA